MPIFEQAFPVVGIGASAGGIAAFESFFAGLPVDLDPGLAFVLVQHLLLLPGNKSHLAELIQRCTRLPVFEAEDGMVVRINCIYTIPAGYDLAFRDGSLHLLPPSTPQGLWRPIDFFFSSLADNLWQRAIGIVLSGTGGDGSLGLTAIKGAGGMAMAQSPESAKYEAMPRSAIATGLVDYELPPAAMIPQLITFAAQTWGKSPRRAIGPCSQTETALTVELAALKAALSVANAALQGQELALVQAAHDMDTLLAASGIATIFVDLELRVLRFTPSATQVLTLSKSDIGRPLADSVSHLVDPAPLLAGIQTVLQTLVESEFEVQTELGQWYTTRILPYRTGSTVFVGAVITFVEITATVQARVALQAARDYAENIVATVREPLLVLGPDLTVLTASRNFYETFKVQPAETIGSFIYDLGNRQWDIPELRRLLAEILPQATSFDNYQVEHDFQTIGRKVIMLNARQIFRQDIGSKIILLALEDISQRKRMEEALRLAQIDLQTSEERYFDLYNLAPVGYCTVSPQGLILMANQTAGTLLDPISGVVTLAQTPFLRFVVAEDHPIFSQHLNQLRETVEQQSFELRLQPRGGKLFWAQLLTSITEDREGVAVYNFVLSDISALKQTEWALGERLKELACMQDISMMLELPGISLDHILLRTIMLIPPAWQFPERTAARMTVHGRSFQTGRFTKTTWMLSRGIIVHDKEVGRLEVCYLGEDLPSAEGPFLIEEHRLLTSIALRVGNVIERLQVEEEKGELQAHLHQAQKMEAIGVLAGGIAHDFNNILAIVLGFSEMALDDAQPDSQSAKDFAMVVAAAHRAKDLVAQILAFSRQSSVECMLLRVQPLVKESLKMLRASLPSTITIKENIFPQCGAILADPTQVHQIVMNLCTNAFHAMEHSGGTLSVGLKPRVFDQQLVFAGQQLTAGEYVELTVSDTGCGIEPEIMAKIFDPYFTTKEVGKGTGMGLSISQGIIRSYGGIITLESTLGQGTTFRVLFPVIHEEIKAVAEEEAPARGSEHILLVDDEEAVCAMGKAVLGRLGYIVTTHSRSNEALAAFAENPARFDLVISDQTMPGLTGIELARQLLAIRPELPIILCTGFSNQIDEASAKVIGIRELAVKPINLVTFGNLVRKVLDGG